MSTSEDSMTNHLGEFSPRKILKCHGLAIVRAVLRTNRHDLPSGKPVVDVAVSLCRTMTRARRHARRVTYDLGIDL